MAKRVIHLIRHGQYNIDKKSELYNSLTPLGKKQAKWASKRLRDYPIEKITSSTSLRAKETADIVCENLDYSKNIKRSRLLLEGVPCFNAKLKRKHSEYSIEYYQKEKARMDKAFESFFIPLKKAKSDRHELLVCHGNIIRYLVTKALKVRSLAWCDMDILQCSLTTIEVKQNGDCRLLSFNETGHIPIKSRTFL